MTTEKRGSEKLLDQQGELCSLTAEELEQVSGGAAPVIINGPGFPLGTLPPDVINRLNVIQEFEIPIITGFPRGTPRPDLFNNRFN